MKRILDVLAKFFYTNILSSRKIVYIPVRGVITRLLMGTRNIDIEDESPYFLPRRRRSDIVFSALTRMNPLYISTFLYAYGSTKASYVIFPLQNGSSLLRRDRRLKRIVKIKIIMLGREGIRLKIYSRDLYETRWWTFKWELVPLWSP